jgi:hypothetical protein
MYETPGRQVYVRLKTWMRMILGTESRTMSWSPTWPLKMLEQVRARRMSVGIWVDGQT